jgi:hypothetical protein
VLRLTAAVSAAPWSSRLTGISSCLPVIVVGTAGTATMASGTCRGETLARMLRRIRVIRSSSKGGAREDDEQRHVVVAVGSSAPMTRLSAISGSPLPLGWED